MQIGGVAIQLGGGVQHADHAKALLPSEGAQRRDRGRRQHDRHLVANPQAEPTRRLDAEQQPEVPGLQQAGEPASAKRGFHDELLESGHPPIVHGVDAGQANARGRVAGGQ